MRFRIRRGYLKKRMETKDTKIPATIYINMKFRIGEVTLVASSSGTPPPGREMA